MSVLLTVDGICGTNNYAADYYSCLLVVLVLVFSSVIVIISDDLWMSYDDLKSTAICQFKSPFPSVDPREVHIVMWRSRPLRLNARSHAVPVIRSTPVSTAAMAIDSVPPTAAVTSSAVPIYVPAAVNSQLLTARQKSEQQLKESSDVFSMRPPVIAGALRQRVCTEFNYCHELQYELALSSTSRLYC